ncbi:MAG: hypothetical protein HQK71_03890 [Desulfamplus sp.]|nr:hypothetical protein [Desulfamplus sp.]
MKMLSALSRREQNMVLSAFIAILLFIIAHFIFFPAVDRRKSLESQLNAKKEALKEMLELSQDYEAIKRSVMDEINLTMRRDKSFTLFSFIDRLAQESSVKDNVAYMKPATRKSESGDTQFSIVKVKLDDVVIKQIVDFIYKIESSDNLVRISSLSISKASDKKKLSAIVETETIILSKG